MKRKLLCLAPIVLFMFLFSVAYASPKPCTITTKIREVELKIDESTVVEFDLNGIIPDDARIIATFDRAICDVSWGENRTSPTGMISQLNITGVQFGESPLYVYFEGHEDAVTSITVKVINEPGTISFLGIPWDITPKEFEQVLKDKGLEFTSNYNISTSDYWFRFDGVPYEYPYTLDMEIKPCSYTYRSSKNTENSFFPLLTVAGYSVKSIEAEFKPSYSYSNKRIGEPYRLARATYSINEYDIPKQMTIWEVYDDLTAKLTKLYGIPTGSKKEKTFYLQTTWWHAEDGTGVSLKLISMSIVGYSIKIEYGVADESAYLNNVYAIRQWEKQQVVDKLSEDVNGL